MDQKTTTAATLPKTAAATAPAAATAATDLLPTTTLNVKCSFLLTYIVLITTGTITFIESIRTNNPTVRHLLNLETCISIIAGYFYSILNDKIKEGHIIDWPSITKLRYMDWCITTPLMLLVLCTVLGNGSHVPVHLATITGIVILNYMMLYFGYLGETQRLSRLIACVAGFVPFVAIFVLIYHVYLRPRPTMATSVFFYTFVFVWSLYGLVFLLEEGTKNVAMNILDLTAKCLMGLGLWAYYTKIVVW